MTLFNNALYASIIDCDFFFLWDIFREKGRRKKAVSFKSFCFGARRREQNAKIPTHDSGSCCNKVIH